MKNGTALLLCWLALAMTAAGQTVSANASHIQLVAKNTYAILHEDATDEWPHGNTGVIIGEDGVMVVDACYLPSMAREDIRLIRGVTNKPVKYLVFTHWHFDHNNGTIAYRDSFPGISIISERETRRWIELNGTWWAKRSTAPGSTKRKSLGELEARLTGGVDSSGNALPVEEVSRLKKVTGQRRNELAELETLQVVAPNRVFDSTLIVDLGKRKVVLHNWDRANSPHDVTVYLPAEQVLFAGDILVRSPLPYVGASWPLPWIDVLGKLQRIPVKAIVPGHGPVMQDHRYTAMLHDFLEAARKKTEAMILEGKTIEQVQSTINMDEFHKDVWDAAHGVTDDDWKYNLNTLVERLWRGIRGQG